MLRLRKRLLSKLHIAAITTKNRVLKQELSDEKPSIKIPDKSPAKIDALSPKNIAIATTKGNSTTGVAFPILNVATELYLRAVIAQIKNMFTNAEINLLRFISITYHHL